MQAASIHMLHKTLKKLNFNFKREKKCRLQTHQVEEKPLLPVFI
jgi:hypothetical protein